VPEGEQQVAHGCRGGREVDVGDRPDDPGRSRTAGGHRFEVHAGSRRKMMLSVQDKGYHTVLPRRARSCGGYCCPVEMEADP
jgi:hypothetical protein